MLGDRALHAARASCPCWATTTSPTRWRPRWRPPRPAARRARGRGPSHLPRDSPPGRADPRGGRGAVDQRLEVHQHHLDRGGDRGAGPAVRAAARRPPQGRALHAGSLAAARGPLPRGGGLRRGGAARRAGPGRSASGGAGRRLRRGARDGARASPGRETRCCCRRPAPATTCSRTTRSGATASAPRSRRCDRATRRSAIPASCAGRPDSSAWSRSCSSRSASPRPTARPAW